MIDQTGASATDTAFLEWLEGWEQKLKDESLSKLLQEATGPDAVGVFCVDVTNGFCHEGPLSNPRVKKIVRPIADLFQICYQAGIRNFILPQDQHPEDSPEFSSWPIHCVAGSSEAETVPELMKLPFSRLFQIIPKQSISSDLETSLGDYLDTRILDVAICVGDCTDLCLYQLAMYLRLRANARGDAFTVIVPSECVDTYDLPLKSAEVVGALPHPGDLMHRLFLYHLALNGVRIVRNIHA